MDNTRIPLLCRLWGHDLDPDGLDNIKLYCQRCARFLVPTDIRGPREWIADKWTALRIFLRYRH